MKKYELQGVANQNEAKMQALDLKSYHPNLEENSNCISKIFFCYTRKIMQKGARLEKQKQYLTSNDLYDVDKTTNPVQSQKVIDQFYEKLDIKNASQLYTKPDSKEKRVGNYTKLVKVFLNGQHNFAGFLAIIGNLLQFAGPIFLKLILEYLEDEDEDREYIGYIWASALVFCFFTRIFVMQNALHIVNAYSMRILNGSSGLMIKKILRISTAAKKYFEGGRIMNFITVDQQMLFILCQMSSFLYSSPVMIIVSLILIIIELGWIGIITPFVFIFSLMYQKRFNKKIFALRANTMKYKDKRSKAVYEYFNGIKIIKYYAWEEVVYNKVRDIRKFETKYLMENQMIRTVIDLIVNQTPLILSIIIFSVYISVEGDIKPSKAYAALSIFNLIMLPVRMVMFAFMQLTQAKTSTARIDHFMDCEEKNEENQVQNDKLPLGTIEVVNGQFAWENVGTLQHNIQGKALNRMDKNKQEEQSKKDQKEIEEMTNKDKNVLSNINFKAQKGELIAIVGRVASGKTSFLYSLLGELDKVQGTVEKNGSIAYVSQQAWLRNASLRDNILFGKQYDEKLYNKILKICELESDIEILPGGDLTEIGERGVNLSGGQKQRVAIARAIYSEADIFIIDDCLSALDAHVGKHIFNNVFLDYVKDKTVIFVTHALHLLPKFDKICVMSKGEIVEQGTYEELNSKQNSFFKDLSVEMKKQVEKELENQSLSDEDYESFDDLGIEKSTEILQSDDFKKSKIADIQPLEIQKKPSKKSVDLRKKQSTQIENKEMQVMKNQSMIDKQKKQEEMKKLEQGAMVKKEERAVGSVPWRIYVSYMASGGKMTTFWVFFSMSISIVCRIMTDWWVGQWSTEEYDIESYVYILIYFGLGVLVGIFYYIRGYIFAVFTIKSADNYQARLMQTLLKTPMYWFDITPTGRIISRTTKDQDDIDSQLPWSLQYAVQNVFQLIGAIILICVILPYFIIVAVIALFIFQKTVSYYLKSAREIKRIESLAKAPVISTLQEVIAGTYIIRAFKKEQFFLQKYLQEQHSYIVSFVNYNYTQRWISVQTDLFALLIIASACYFSVLSKESNYVDDPSLMGLCISWALQISTMLSFTLKMVADCESQMNALIRMLQYIESNPQEAEWYTAKDKQTLVQNWPSEGGYQIKNITYKYREELPDVIHGITCNIQPQEKVGIVGRTGSGKSTMTLGLMRILELAKDPQNNLGKIILDSNDIAEVGLHDLREKVTIIPQDPILFTGSIKFNLDPYGKFTDQEIIDSLKQVQMWEQLEDIMKKLNQNQNQSVVVQNNNAKQNEGENQNQQQLSEDQKKLQFQVQDGGENFSLGQRQLICMARALVRKPKVLLMDEATASIDEKTDHLIQTMIKSVFKQTTVITIAHRINTIMQYDKIIVLDNGNIVEIDSPLNLLQKQGLFSNLVDEGGPEFRKKMIFLAENKDKNIEDF